MKYLAYLAGPITGLNFNNAIDWREKIIELLPEDIVGISPLRGKNYLANAGPIESSYENIALSSSRGVTHHGASPVASCLSNRCKFG